MRRNVHVLQVDRKTIEKEMGDLGLDMTDKDDVSSSWFSASLKRRMHSHTLHSEYTHTYLNVFVVSESLRRAGSQIPECDPEAEAWGLCTPHLSHAEPECFSSASRPVWRAWCQGMQCTSLWEAHDCLCSVCVLFPQRFALYAFQIHFYFIICLTFQLWNKLLAWSIM